MCIMVGHTPRPHLHLLPHLQHPLQHKRGAVCSIAAKCQLRSSPAGPCPKLQTYLRVQLKHALQHGRGLWFQCWIVSLMHACKRVLHWIKAWAVAMSCSHGRVLDAPADSSWPSASCRLRDEAIQHDSCQQRLPNADRAAGDAALQLLTICARQGV